MFRDPISEAEGGHYLAWHECGLSAREMRELIDESGANWDHPERTTNTIRRWLERRGIAPHPSPKGTPTDHDDYCRRHESPVRKKGKKNECFACKTIVDRERTKRVRAGLAERVETLRAAGGEVAEIADWIKENVHPR